MAPFEIFLSQKFYPNVHKNASNCTIKKNGYYYDVGHAEIRHILV